jgi:tRNA A-37 threonylcarbamoyl transferase component Bud32
MDATAAISWHLSPGWDGPPPRLGVWQAAGLVRVVKQAPHRTVWQVSLPGLDVHVKVYRESACRWLRGSRARREYHITREAARRGVSTLDALAWGEDGSASYIITRSLPDAVPFSDLWLGPLAPGQRQELARALGAFLASVHAAGLRHDDLHPGNVLVCRDRADLGLFLIDLDAVRLGAPLSWPACRDNLVVLDRWFALRASAADRFRCWRAYSRAAGLVDERVGARAVERRTRASLLDFSDRLDQRCLGGNRHFRRLRAPGLRGHAVADLDLADLPGNPDLLFEQHAQRVLKRSVSSLVLETSLAGRTVVCKRHEMTRPGGPLAALFRPPPALRSYLLGHALRLRGLPTPRPLAVWHRCRLGLPAQGYLLQEKVPDAVELNVFVEQLARLPRGEGRRRLRELVEQVARLVRSLHGWKLSHRDLKAANLLVSPQGWFMGPRGVCESAADGGDHVWFVDLVGARKHRWLGRARKAQNLARLNASFISQPAITRTTRLRFLLTYLAGERASWKKWWRRVEAATRAKIERNRRRGRALT